MPGSIMGIWIIARLISPSPDVGGINYELLPNSQKQKLAR
jgi:hypothetical protein